MPGHKITEMYAFIMEDEDGDEAIPAFYSQGSWLPMIGADLRRIGQLRPMAQEVANQRGVPYRLVTFSINEDVETYVPPRKNTDG